MRLLVVCSVSKLLDSHRGGRRISSARPYGCAPLSCFQRQVFLGESSFSEATNPYYSTSHKGKKATAFQLWDLSAFGTIFDKLYLLFPSSLNEVVFSSDSTFWVFRGSVCLWDAVQHAWETVWALCRSCAASPAALFWRWEPVRARGKVP